jgi:hypothetical protein
LDQSRIDFLSAQIVKRWVYQDACRESQPVDDENWVDGVVCRLIPGLLLTVASAAMMGQSDVHDFVSQGAFDLG